MCVCSITKICVSASQIILYGRELVKYVCMGGCCLVMVLQYFNFLIGSDGQALVTP